MVSSFGSIRSHICGKLNPFNVSDTESVPNTCTGELKMIDSAKFCKNFEWLRIRSSGNSMPANRPFSCNDFSNSMSSVKLKKKKLLHLIRRDNLSHSPKIAFCNVIGSCEFRQIVSEINCCNWFPFNVPYNWTFLVAVKFKNRCGAKNVCLD